MENSIDNVLLTIGRYISEDRDPPIELFQKLKELSENNRDKRNSYREYLEVVELNKRYERVISVLIDYIKKQLNARAEYKTDIMPVFSDYDILTREVTVHSIVIPRVELRFMEGLSRPIQVYLE